MTTTTATPIQATPVGDDTTRRLYVVGQLFAEAERAAIGRVHKAIVDARDERPRRRWWQKRRDGDELLPGLTRAAEIAATHLRDITTR